MPTASPMADSWHMKRSHVRAALASMVVAAPTLVASLPGDWFDEDVEGLKRNIEPIDLPDPVHLAICVLAAAALAASLVVLLSPSGRQVPKRAEVKVAAPMLVVGLYVAFTYRVLSAEVTGANIGGGLLFLLGVPLVPGLLVLAGVNAWRARHSEERWQRRA